MDNDISVYRKEHYHFQNFGNIKNSAPSTSDTCSNRYNSRKVQKEFIWSCSLLCVITTKVELH